LEQDSAVYQPIFHTSHPIYSMDKRGQTEMMIAGLKGITVFVVDDDPNYLNVIVDSLTRFELKVIPLKSGEAALALIEKRQPDIILLDVQMPGSIDGFETCRRLKANPQSQDIPVIFISAASEAVDKVTGFSLGGVDYITKPVEVEELLSRLYVHITIRRLQQDLQEANKTLEEKVLARTNELTTANKQLRQEITERRRAEEELKKHRDHLEEMVETRTKELKGAQDELVRKERLAALGQLTATVAHEIRNPLGTVQTSVFSIGDAIERKEMKRVDRALSLAARNIRRCDGIITELLDFTRQKELKPAPMDIDAWLGGLLDEQKIPEEIECRRAINAGILVPFDPEYLRRAVINVVTNAVQALAEEESAGKELKVKTAVAGNRLEIRVIDNGPGIPDDIREKIFDPLFSTRSFGVGLGLAIVKDIMAEHGGGIEVESKVGKGTAVVLWLPVEKQMPNPDKLEAE